MITTELITRQRREIDRKDAETMERLVKAYRLRYEKMRRDGDGMVAYIAAHPDQSPETIRKSKRYRDLVAEYESDLDEYANYLQTEISVGTNAALTTGEKHALALIAATGAAGVAANLAGLPPDVVQTMMAFMSPKSELYQRIKQLAPYHADQIARSLVDAVVLGVNPLDTGKERIAPLLRIAYASLEKSAGLALTDALRMARTSQLWAYRESSRATYIVNQDVVTGWYWSAELDADTCMSCVAQHGTFHTLDEQLDDHYNGRCAMIPAVAGQPSPIDETGIQWFESQPESVQSQMMGPEFYAAYQRGDFTIEQMSRVTEDPTYGHMHTVTPLYILEGGDG